MKRLLIAFMICCSPLMVVAQTPVDSIMVIPSNPTTSDFVRVVKMVFTQSQGGLIGNSAWVGSSQVIITACYYVTVFASPETFYDTVDVGFIPAGTYDLNYITGFTLPNTSCAFDTGNNFHSTSLTVIDDLAVDEINTNQFKIFPNPSRGTIHIEGLLESELKSIRLLHLNGTIISELELLDPLILDVPNGSYFLQITTQRGVQIMKRVVKV